MEPIDRQKKHLHPTLREMVEELLEEATIQGLPFELFEGFRSLERQAELWAQGRTRPGSIVTKVRPGRSIHNFALAADLALRIGGRWSWESEGERQRLWIELGSMGRNLGLTWGGDRPSFQDLPHFQWTGGKTIREFRRRDFPGGAEEEWLDFINGQLDLFFGRAREIQEILKELGHYRGAIDGILGRESTSAIKLFQAEHSLEPDGIAGPLTWARLQEVKEG